MSILNNDIRPVNQPQRVTNTEGKSNLINVATLPLFTEGNTLKASELLIKLNEAKEARPKVIRSNTPRGVVRNIPKIADMYEMTTGKKLPANELSSIREVLIDGKITSIQSISEAVMGKFFRDGSNTAPDSALAYAEMFNNLASTLVEYAAELKTTKESYLALTKYNIETVDALAELYEAQYLCEETFAANGSSWEGENARRERDAKTERMFQKFDAFEIWEKEQSKA